MSQDNPIAIQDVLDNGPWSLLQKMAALMAAGAVLLDGFDIQVLGFAVPSIATEWHLAKSSFALIFGVSLAAIAAGHLTGGWIGDRFGRRKALFFAVLWFGIATLLLANATSLNGIFVWRMISSLGIGAALPNATAYIAEITPSRFRTTVLSASIVCIPGGGLFGGIIAAHLLPVASWRVLILIAGTLPFLLALLIWIALPESPRFLAAHPANHQRLRQQLHRFGMPVATDAVFVAESIPTSQEGVGTLLRPPYRRDTLSVWAAFCFCLISVFLVFNWLPSMLTTLGMGPAAASNGLAIYNFGGIAGAILFGLWMNHRGSRLPLLLAAACAVLSALWPALHLIVAPAGTPLLTVQLGVQGFFVNAVQTALYAVAAHLYPTRFRSRGVAIASAFGRAGAVASAFLGGKALQHSGQDYFLLLTLTLSCVTISLLFLRNHIPGTRSLSPA